MRFLVDNALSPTVADGLRQAGHDAVHVRERGLSAAPDSDILVFGAKEKRIIVSADTDFGTILATRQLAEPSFLLLRRSDKRPVAQLALILANLARIAVPSTLGDRDIWPGSRNRRCCPEFGKG